MTDQARVAVLGAGTMGHGIAQVAAMAGYPVRLYDVSADAVERGMDHVRRNLQKGVDRGKVATEQQHSTLANLVGEPSLDSAVAECEWIIEAIPEDLALKAELFRDLRSKMAPSAFLASNTSSLSIAELASHVPDPSRFLGLHFFNPVHIMALVEVVYGPATETDTLDAALALVRTLGKEPIVVKDSPGFASSRLGVALGMEAIRMLEEGVASAEDIDKAMELGYRHPMGPLKLTDLVGLDVRLGIARYLHEALGSPRFEPPALLESMVAEGRLGKKAGRGFYEWD